MKDLIHFHDPYYSLLQSGLAEYLRKENNVPPGLILDHEHMKALNRVLTHKYQAKLETSKPGCLGFIVNLFKSIFAGKATFVPNSDLEECILLFVERAEAKLLGDEEKVTQITNVLQESNCDLRWIESVTQWFYYYKVLHEQPKYINYEQLSDFVYPLPKVENRDLKVAVIGDWGTGTQVATLLLDLLFQQKPDVIIHLGDVYYAGTEEEMKNNFGDIIDQMRSKHQWPVPVYNMAGNHDYYSGGQAFYTLNETLNKGIDTGHIQEASFFSLINDHWQLQAMDSGFYDHDTLDSKDDITHLHESEVVWHKNKIEEGKKAGRKIILLSHHQYFSALDHIGTHNLNYNTYFESYFGEYIKSNQIDAWFWGHSHLMELYEPFMGLNKGRCIGHGALPVFYENGKPYQPSYDNVKLIPNTQLPHNNLVYDHGYMMLELGEKTGKATYYSITGDGSSSTLKVNYEETI